MEYDENQLAKHQQRLSNDLVERKWKMLMATFMDESFRERELTELYRLPPA